MNIAYVKTIDKSLFFKKCSMNFSFPPIQLTDMLRCAVFIMDDDCNMPIN